MITAQNLTQSQIEHAFLEPHESPPKGMLTVCQVHGNEVVSLFETQKAIEYKPQNADAMVTNQAVCLGVQTADCLPVLFSANQITAVAHAGWCGLLSGILVKTTQLIKEKVETKDIKVALGPAIGPCCFEVSKDVVDQFMLAWGKLWESKKPPFFSSPIECRQPTAAPWHEGQFFLNLKEIAKLQLTHLGIPTLNIEDIQECTYCSIKKLESYRRNKKAGRQWSYIRRN